MKQWRKTAGITQETAGLSIGVDRVQWQKRENGTADGKNPTLESLLKIAGAMDVPFSELADMIWPSGSQGLAVETPVLRATESSPRTSGSSLVFEHLFDYTGSMFPANLPLAAHVVGAARTRAQAEHAEWEAVLDLRESLIARLDVDTSLTPMYRRMAINEVALEIAQLLHISEQQVWRIVEQGGRLRDRAPAVWSAFAAGSIGVQKASTISVAIERCRQPETVAALESGAVDYATTHTNSELRRWINKLIDRLEPLDVSEADAERAKRNVELRHTFHGMSEVVAYVPTPAAVAIHSRLRKAAKTIDDDRTQPQKQADLFCAWLTNATGTECDITAEIAVVVEAEALAGVTDAPAHVLDTDDDLAVPVPWVFELAAAESTLWTRLITDPYSRVLDVTHLGYQPPAVLRKAVQWRDRTCRVSGCSRRAELTDLDHRRPYHTGGATSGRNLQCLCRRHHGMKGHGLLTDDAYAPPEYQLVRLPRPPIKVDYIPAA